MYYKKMTSTYCIDIDNTICYTADKNYSNSKPIFSRIDYINNLYDNGNIIKYFTARGMGRFDGHRPTHHHHRRRHCPKYCCCCWP
jgi:hypothetical protein